MCIVIEAGMGETMRLIQYTYHPNPHTRIIDSKKVFDKPDNTIHDIR